MPLCHLSTQWPRAIPHQSCALWCVLEAPFAIRRGWPGVTYQSALFIGDAIFHQHVMLCGVVATSGAILSTTFWLGYTVDIFCVLFKQHSASIMVALRFSILGSFVYQHSSIGVVSVPVVQHIHQHP